MFYSLTGTVVFAGENSVALDCSGVAFKLLTTRNTLRKTAPAGERQTLYAFLNVRDDALDLFGFADESELECFKTLIGASGVGPKAALALLSELTPDELALAVAADDVKAITVAQGVGPKLARRIILELKGKLDVFVSAPGSERAAAAAKAAAKGREGEDAVEALVALGYGRSEASLAVAAAPNDGLSAEELIKTALRSLAGKP